jgi:serine/threonine protein kinase
VTPERWRQVQTVFGAVVDEPADRRDQRLRELCRDDEELAREVVSLLAADHAASAVIGGPPAPMPIAAPSPAVPVGTRVGEYEIRSLLGQGGMGTVYAGIHPVIEKAVAIKVLDARLASTDGIVDRFVREARAVNKIHHPNIIDIFAFGHAPGVGHYFVMPRLVGETLGARVARGPMSLAEALPIIEQIADALDAAHGAGVLHRDLKPDNVFLVADRRGGVTVQVLDFGIAKLLDGVSAAVTRSGVQIGTPLFMSPEQWDGVVVDQRTDVYALGVMIHHVLTGRFPFESTSPLALMNMHANRPPPAASLHGAPPAVDAVIARALAKSRDDRPSSTGELYAELAAAAGVAVRAPHSHSAARAGTGPVGSPPSPPSTPVTTLSGSIGVRDRPASVRGRMAFAMIGLVVAGGAVVLAVTLGRHDRDGAPAGGEPAHGVSLAPDAAPPVDAPAPSETEAPTAVVPPRRRSTVDARRARSHSVDARPARAVVAPDARIAVPRSTADAAPRRADAAPRRADAAPWGTTVNPFPEQP